MRFAAAFLAIALAAPVEGRASEGLDLETATALHQDRAGFVWVGTRERLLRYDGYESVSYEHDLANPRSISDNDIRSVFEDRAGNLWVATNTGGLNRLDPARRGFTSYRHDPADPRSLVHDSVYAVAEDRDGKIWVGTQGGVCRLDPVSGRFDRFPAGSGGPTHDWVIDLLVDRDGVLWVGTNGGGLNRGDPATGTFRASGGPFAYGLVEGDGTALWVANDVGVYRFDRALGTETPVPFEDGGARIVTALTREPDGTLWAGTFDAGVWYLAPGSRALRRQPIPGDGTPAAVNRIVDLMVDAAGTVWVGSWGTGLHRVTRGARQFREAGPIPDRSDVTAVFGDRRGSLWFGGGEGGRSGNLRRVDAEGRVTVYSIDGAPLSLLDPGGGRLWVGTTSGCRSLDVRTGRRDVVEGVGATWVWDLVADRGGSVWIAAGDRGLLRRNADGVLERFVPDPADPGTISDSYPTSLLEDREGTIWIGTRSGGLNTWSPRTRKFTRHLPDVRLVRRQLPSPRACARHRRRIDRGGRVPAAAVLRRAARGRGLPPPCAPALAPCRAALGGVPSFAVGLGPLRILGARRANRPDRRRPRRRAPRALPDPRASPPRRRREGRRRTPARTNPARSAHRALLEIFACRADLILENLALRQQLAVLRQKQPRPRLRASDRLFWLTLRRCWPRWKETLAIVQPETVIRWHREGFRR